MPRELASFDTLQLLVKTTVSTHIYASKLGVELGGYCEIIYNSYNDKHLGHLNV